MKLYKTKLWTPANIGLLKWSCIFSGMIVGSFFPEFIQRHLWPMLAVVILLAIKPTVDYFRDDTPRQ